MGATGPGVTLADCHARDGTCPLVLFGNDGRHPGFSRWQVRLGHLCSPDTGPGDGARHQQPHQRLGGLCQRCRSGQLLSGAVRSSAAGTRFADATSIDGVHRRHRFAGTLIGHCAGLLSRRYDLAVDGNRCILCPVLHVSPQVYRHWRVGAIGHLPGVR
jgi:hypothetical protein